MERSREEAWSPLASTEDIQRRLIRPSSLRFTPPISFPLSTPLRLPLLNTAVPHRSDARSRENSPTKKEARARETENKKLEDYLDPALLSVLSSKIGRHKDVEMKKQKRERAMEKFRWPVDELKVFANDRRMEKPMDWSSYEVVNLEDDNGIDQRQA